MRASFIALVVVSCRVMAYMGVPDEVPLCSIMDCGRKDAIGVKGRILCNGETHHTIVQLWEEDDGLDIWWNPDDFLGQTATVRNQDYFQLTAHEDESGDPEPYLILHHRCTVLSDQVCSRVPLSFTRDKWIDLGTIDVGKLRWYYETECEKYARKFGKSP